MLAKDSIVFTLGLAAVLIVVHLSMVLLTVASTHLQLKIAATSCTQYCTNKIVYWITFSVLAPLDAAITFRDGTQNKTDANGANYCASNVN